jgi:hypothetical protein
MVELAGQGRETAQRLTAQVVARAGQIRQPPRQTGWQLGEQRMQGVQQGVQSNRFALAALLLAGTLLGGARWLDQKQNQSREEL